MFELWTGCAANEMDVVLGYVVVLECYVLGVFAVLEHGQDLLGAGEGVQFVEGVLCLLFLGGAG